MKRRATAIATTRNEVPRELGVLAQSVLALQLLSDRLMSSSWVFATIGGVMIGGASALLLASHGRIAGISGIAGGLLAHALDRTWRVAFVIGLVVAGAGAGLLAPSAVGAPARSPFSIVIAGLLVGFGTRLGSGCTSGHGVCGLGRRSVRSLVAVATFMTTGALTAMLGGRTP